LLAHDHGPGLFLDIAPRQNVAISPNSADRCAHLGSANMRKVSTPHFEQMFRSNLADIEIVHADEMRRQSVEFAVD